MSIELTPSVKRWKFSKQELVTELYFSNISNSNKGSIRRETTQQIRIC